MMDVSPGGAKKWLSPDTATLSELDSREGYKVSSQAFVAFI